MPYLLMTASLIILAALLSCSGATPAPETTHPALAENPAGRPGATRAGMPATMSQPAAISPTPASRRTSTAPTPIQQPPTTKAGAPLPTLSLTEAPTAESKAAGSAMGTPPLQALRELLSMVPPEFAGDTLVFSFNGLGSQGGHGQFPGGRAMHPEIASSIINLKEMLGLDFRNYQRGIWSWKPGNRSRTFMAFRGPIEGQQTADKLEDLGFGETSHMGTAYYELDEDFSFDIKHQLRRTGLLLNRLVLPGDVVLAAPATEIIESLIAARQTGSQALSTSSPHSALADAAGGGLVSGAFFRPGWILETWNTVNPGPADRLERYRSGPEAWGTLSEYSLALLGYRAGESGDEMTIALYYSPAADAGADSRELAARWDSYHYNPSGPLGEDGEIPLNQACYPLSVHTIQNAEHSIIVGRCPIIENAGTDSGIGGASVWPWLFDTRQLEFLAPDVEDLE